MNTSKDRPKRVLLFGERWPELRAVILWALRSWLRPAGSEAGWEQGSEADKRRRAPFG